MFCKRLKNFHIEILDKSQDFTLFSTSTNIEMYGDFQKDDLKYQLQKYGWGWNIQLANLR